MGNSYTNICGNNNQYNNGEVQIHSSLLSSSSDNMQSTYSRKLCKSPFKIFDMKCAPSQQPKCKNYFTETYSTNPQIRLNSKVIMLQRFVKNWLKILHTTLRFEYFDSDGLLDIDNLDNSQALTSKKTSVSGNLLKCKTRESTLRSGVINKVQSSFKYMDIKIMKADKVCVLTRVPEDILKTLNMSGFKLKPLQSSIASLLIGNMSVFGFFSDHSFNGLGLSRNENCYFKGNCVIIKIEGEFEYNTFKGFGFSSGITGFKSNYLGEWDNNLYDGYGIELSDRGIYQGQFQKGQKRGYGKLVNQNGDYYIGEWSKNLENGLGLACQSNGYMYIGYYVNGKANGYGEQSFKSEGHSEKYIGYFKQGMKHGYGLLHNLNSEILIVGTWKEGKMEGPNIQITSSQGKTYCQMNKGTKFKSFSSRQEFENYNSLSYDLQKKVSILFDLSETSFIKTIFLPSTSS